MKPSQKAELRRLSKKQLLKKLEELKRQKIGLEHKFRPGYERTAFADKGSPPIFKKVRRTIAIVNTILKEKEWASKIGILNPRKNKHFVRPCPRIIGG